MSLRNYVTFKGTFYSKENGQHLDWAVVIQMNILNELSKLIEIQLEDLHIKRYKLKKKLELLILE